MKKALAIAALLLAGCTSTKQVKDSFFTWEKVDYTCSKPIDGVIEYKRYLGHAEAAYRPINPDDVKKFCHGYEEPPSYP